MGGGVEPRLARESASETTRNQWGYTRGAERDLLTRLVGEAYDARLVGRDLGKGPPRNMTSSLEVLRYLRAREYDVPKAKAMLADFVRWRREYRADEALDWEFPWVEAARDLYPNGYHGVDKEGRPVYFQEMGHLDVARLLAIDGCSIDAVVQLFVKNFELFLERCGHFPAAGTAPADTSPPTATPAAPPPAAPRTVAGAPPAPRARPTPGRRTPRRPPRAPRRLAPACALLSGRPVTQYTAVMDLKGVGLKNFSGDARTILKHTTTISEANYPETMAKVL